MKIKYKYLIVNFIWWILFSIVMNISFYIWLNQYIKVIIFVEFILLFISSFCTQVDLVNKSEKTLWNGLQEVKYMFIGTFTIIFSCILGVFLIHCLFDYNSVFFEGYMKAILVALSFCVFMPRIYLHENY